MWIGAANNESTLVKVYIVYVICYVFSKFLEVVILLL